MCWFCVCTVYQYHGTHVYLDDVYAYAVCEHRDTQHTMKRKEEVNQTHHRNCDLYFLWGDELVTLFQVFSLFWCHSFVISTTRKEAHNCRLTACDGDFFWSMNDSLHSYNRFERYEASKQNDRLHCNHMESNYSGMLWVLKNAFF